MAVITISKEYAAGGVQLAQKLVSTLGYKLVGRAILDELSQRLGKSEAEVELMKRAQGTRWIRLADNYLLHTIHKITQQPNEGLDDNQYFAAVEHLVRDVAAEGDVVILGWGGQCILRGMPGVVHLRVVAPLALRGERLAKQKRIPTEHAQSECQRQDGYSQSYVKHYLEADWDDPLAYHAVLNMGALGFDLDKAAAMVRPLL